MDQNIRPYVLNRNSPLKLIFRSNLVFFINLKVNYDQTVLQRHVYIRILIEKHPTLAKIGIPATHNENMDKIPDPLM